LYIHASLYGTIRALALNLQPCVRIKEKKDGGKRNNILLEG
jgi:hypothetical protein